MRNNKHINKDLENLNDGIIWKSERQERVRSRLNRQMTHSKGKSMSWVKRRFIPVSSLLLLVTVITTIFLSEFNNQEVADNGHDPSHDHDDTPSEVITDNKNNDEENNNEKDNDVETGTTNDNDNNDQGEVPDETNETKPESPETNDPDESDERILTEKEVLHAIKGQLSTDIPVTLPDSLPLSDGQHLTAVTNSEAKKYEVVFYQHDEPIPINNNLLVSDDNPAEVVARLTVEQYDTQEEADEVIAHEDFDDETGEEVDLGYDLTGYQDAGAGSVWTSFNAGRWALATHATTEHPDESEALAKTVGDFLQDHVLPVPEENGFAHLDAENQDNRILWEKGTTVYTIDQVNVPMDALDIATSFQ